MTKLTNTMKKILSKNTLALVSVLVVALALGQVHAGGYNNPPSNPPASNTESLINVSTTDQSKIGGLSVAGFAAYQAAELDQKVYLHGIVRGGTPTNPGALVSIGSSAGYNAGLAATGDLSAVSFLQSQLVANTASDPSLCADSNGKIILCSSGTTASTGTATPAPTATTGTIKINYIGRGSQTGGATVWLNGYYNLPGYGNGPWISVIQVANTQGVLNSVAPGHYSITSITYGNCPDNAARIDSGAGGDVVAGQTLTIQLSCH